MPKNEEEGGDEHRGIQGNFGMEAFFAALGEVAIQIAGKNKVLCEGADKPERIIISLEGAGSELAVNGGDTHDGQGADDGDPPPQAGRGPGAKANAAAAGYGKGEDEGDEK